MRLPIAALLMLMMAGMMLFLFIGFNYAFNSDGGIKEQIWKAGNETMTGDRKTKFDEMMPKLTQGFGISSVLCFLFAIVIFVVDAFGNPPQQVQ